MEWYEREYEALKDSFDSSLDREECHSEELSGILNEMNDVVWSR
jgi:hypothetical protein